MRHLVPNLILAAALAASAAGASAPNDPLYASGQWGPQQIRAAEAWELTTGAGVVIAILDSGLDLAHADFAGQLVAGATFNGCGTAPEPCGNGHWLDNVPPLVASPHGTHVAGIAAAATDNALGIAGVAPDAKLMPVKVIDDEQGRIEDIVQGIDWARGNGAQVINMSLATLPGSQGFHLVGSFGDLYDAVDRAVAAGIVVVAAAGNDSASGCGEPAFHPDILCVVSTDRLENRSAFSNFAVDDGLNVVAAPGGAAVLACGEDVLSTVPPGVHACAQGAGYAYLPGTSMSAPHVAGLAALLLAGGASAAQAYDAIRATARTPSTGQRGFYTPSFGFGIVDARAAAEHLPEPGSAAGIATSLAALAALARRRRR